MSLTLLNLETGQITRKPQSSSPRGGYRSQINTSYAAASVDRLTHDWARALLSPDQEVRTSLRALRSRSRSLAINNPHMRRFLNAAGEQVVGDSGIGLELTFSEDEFAGADKFNRDFEKAWDRFWACPTADQKLSGPMATRLWLVTVLADGESFVQKIKGYPHNDSNFALQFVDADQVDINLQRLRRPNDPSAPNEIRMGVEVDQYRRVVAYHIYEGHPSEFTGVVRLRVSADQMDQAYLFVRPNQTRGVPWAAPAMLSLHNLGEYDYAEVTASRWAACKMAYFVSKTGPDDYDGGQQDEKKGGEIQTVVEPGMMDILPPGFEPKTVDWQHPSQNYESFSLAALRGISAGINCSYATLTNDLRSVNFSSIRQGILSERDGWAVMQGFTIDRWCWPIVKTWAPMALLTGQFELPARMTLQDVYDHILWTPRGWDWVDPKNDVGASIEALRSGLSTYQRECAKRGLDWRKVFKQRALENKLAKELGLELDLSPGANKPAENDDEDGTGKTKGAMPQ